MQPLRGLRHQSATGSHPGGRCGGGGLGNSAGAWGPAQIHTASFREGLVRHVNLHQFDGFPEID